MTGVLGLVFMARVAAQEFGRDAGVTRDGAHRGAVKAVLGDETPERAPYERGTIDKLGTRLGYHTTPASSGIPVSRVDTFQSLAIADSISRRKIGLRTGGPLLTNNGP